MSMNTDIKKTFTIDRILLLGILMVQVGLLYIFLRPAPDALSNSGIQRHSNQTVLIRDGDSDSSTNTYIQLSDIFSENEADDTTPGSVEAEMQNLFESVLRQSPFFNATNEFYLNTSGSPLRRMRDIQKQMNKMMEMSARDFEMIDNLMNFDEGWNTLSTSPTMDMRDNGDKYTVLISLPGVSPSDIKVTLNDRLLTVRASQDEQTKHSRGHRSFEKRILLPGPVDAEGLSSTALENGVLRIIIPKDNSGKTSDGKTVLE